MKERAISGGLFSDSTMPHPFGSPKKHTFADLQKTVVCRQPELPVLLHRPQPLALKLLPHSSGL